MKCCGISEQVETLASVAFNFVQQRWVFTSFDLGSFHSQLRTVTVNVELPRKTAPLQNQMK